MRRRRSRGTVLPKTMLGPWYEKVHLKIKETMKQEVAMFAPFPLDNKTVIEHCVTPHVLNVLAEAKKYKAGYDAGVGTIPWEFTNELRGSFVVDFDAFGSLVPKPPFIEPDNWVMTQLQPWSEQVGAIYRKWSVVHHVANWFDTYSSISACRYYWPVMMALLPQGCPKLQELHEARIGSHQKEPKDIGSILPLARETATYVTAGQLLPAPEPATRIRDNVKLNMHGGPFAYQDHNGLAHMIISSEMTFDL